MSVTNTEITLTNWCDSIPSEEWRRGGSNDITLQDYPALSDLTAQH